jgi:hypothetical protein
MIAAQTAMIQSYNLTKHTDLPTILEFMSNIPNTVASLKSILNVPTSKAVSSTVTKRATRSINRSIAAMLDNLETLKETKSQTAEVTGLEKQKLLFLQTFTTLLQEFMNTISLNAGSYVQDTYVNIIQFQLPKMIKSYHDLQQQHAKIIKAAEVWYGWAFHLDKIALFIDCVLFEFLFRPLEEYLIDLALGNFWKLLEWDITKSNALTYFKIFETVIEPLDNIRSTFFNNRMVHCSEKVD